MLIDDFCVDKAHLGVRLKREGYTVIAADWKKQEYFEEVELLNIFIFLSVNSLLM